MAPWQSSWVWLLTQVRDSGPWSAPGHAGAPGASGGMLEGDLALASVGGLKASGCWVSCHCSVALRPPCHAVTTGLSGVAVPPGAEQSPPRGRAQLRSPSHALQQPSLVAGASLCNCGAFCLQGLPVRSWPPPALRPPLGPPSASMASSGSGSAP